MWAILNSSRKLFSFTPQRRLATLATNFQKFGTVLYEISSFLHFSEGGGGRWEKEALNQNKDRISDFRYRSAARPFILSSQDELKTD
jgi:hypothetical protein